jgi:DNA-binding MarR family transcriptional regulator
MSSRPPTAFLETFGQVRRGLTAFIDAAYGTLGVGATQAKLLRRIGENSHVSQADLARATRTDPALTGRALQTLLDRGWVERRRSREDRRAFSLELTRSGEALVRKVLTAREAVALQVVSCLNDEDLDAFDRMAAKLLKSFPEQPGESREMVSPGSKSRPGRRRPARRGRGRSG